MDAQTVTLVEDSWRKVAPIAPQAAELFYRNIQAWADVYGVMADVMINAAH